MNISQENKLIIIHHRLSRQNINHITVKTVLHDRKRDITLPTKVCLVKAMVFPVVMYRCESWTIKKAELRRIDAFEL